MSFHWLSHLAVAAALSGAAYGAWQWAGAPDGTLPVVDQSALAPKVAADATLVDVRTPGEFARRHVAGARNLPLGELRQRMAELGPQDQPVIVYCRTGSRSSMAKRLLEQAGFSNVLDLGSLGNAQRVMMRSPE